MKSFFMVFVSLVLVLMFTTNILAQDESKEKIVIKRYLVERSFPDGLVIPVNEQGS
jgi:hypothetical protein